MANKTKKIVFSILFTTLLALSFAFICIKPTKAENVDYDSYSWRLKYGTLMTNYEASLLTATTATITSVVPGGTTDAYFNMQYGTDANNPITQTYIIQFNVIHPTSTTTYINYDFYNKTNRQYVGNISYCDCRITYYASNASTSSYVYLNNVASPTGANTSLQKYWLSTTGFSITSQIVGGSTYSTTTLNNSSKAVELLSRLFTPYISNDEVIFNNGVNVGLANGEQRVINDPNYYGLYNSSQYDANYNTGYEVGYTDGRNSFNAVAIYNNAYNEGYNSGLSASSQDYGISDLLFSIFNVPVAVLSNLFSFSIFNTTVWTVIVSLLIITIVIYIIKRLILFKE